MAVERIIGVDFGTSTSVIRVKRYENGKPIGEKLETKEVIFGGNGAMVPTLIMKKDDDASVCYFGYEAQQKKKKFTNFHSFKMDLESSDPAKRAQARLLTEEFYGYLGKQYKSQSEGGHLGNSDDKERTIISYPVKWSEGTKNFMLETAKKAGFPNVTGMDEAQAAIQAVIVMSTDHLQKHGLLKNGEAANILLIDMGAGTTDLVLARYVPGDEPKTEVLNTWPKSGDIQFGGREIDNLLQNFFREMLDEDDAELVFRRIGSDKFKSWKEDTVSPALRNNDSVSDFEVLDSCVDMMGIDLDEYCLNRSAFENCLADYLKQFPELISGCLLDVGMSGNDVDLVIVTGGHSQWYFVNEMLSGKMPQFGNLDLPKIRENPARIIPITRPQETVALGLAYSGIHFDLSGGTADDAQDGKAALGELGRTLNVVKEQKREQAYEPTAEGFMMKFDPATKAFTLSGQGTVVIGTIVQGTVKTGDKVYVCGGPGQPRMAQVKKIALHQENKNITTAYKGDFVAVLLSGISVDNANRATYIANKPDDDIEPSVNHVTRGSDPKGATDEKENWSAEELVIQFVADYPYSELNKFSNVKNSSVAKQRGYLHVPADEPILIAKDCTIFSSGKSGTILTPRGIYIREDFGEPYKHGWYEFITSEFVQTGAMIKTTDTNITMGYFLGGGEAVLSFYKALQSFLRQYPDCRKHTPSPQVQKELLTMLAQKHDQQEQMELARLEAERQEKIRRMQEKQEQERIEREKKLQALEEARRRAAVIMQIDPESIPYTPENEFEIGNVGRNDCSVRKYTGNNTVIKIPATIRGRKVVEIEKEAFGAIIVPKANTTLETVIIPDTVVRIGESAFRCCTNLRYIRANNVRDIGANAFLGCQKLDNPILGNNVVNIGANAFNSCVSLKTAAFGKNVEKIGMNAFLACRNLQHLDFGMGDCAEGHVIFPPKLKSIGAQAFHTNELLHATRCIFKEIQMSKHTKVINLPAAPCFNPRYCAVFYYD